MEPTNEIAKNIDDAMTELDRLADELRVRLHLAGMDFAAAWNDKLEPLLFDARSRAKEATRESLSAVKKVLEEFRVFSRGCSAHQAAATMAVRDLMTKDVGTCRAEDVVGRAAQIMWDRACGSVPVVDEARRPIAMLTDRDICMAAYIQGRPLENIAVSSAMSRHLYKVNVHDKLATAEAIMRRNGLRRLPVVDDEGVLVGLLSLDDILRRAPLEPPVTREPLSARTIAATASAAAHTSPAGS